MTPTPHIPIEKKQTREQLLSQYLAWRNSGGVPTVITRETLKQKGMRKRGRWGEELDSMKVRKAPMNLTIGRTA